MLRAPIVTSQCIWSSLHPQQSRLRRSWLLSTAVIRRLTLHTTAVKTDRLVNLPGEPFVTLQVDEGDVAPGGARLRLDAFLAESLPSSSRAQIQEAIKQGGVTVNGAAAGKAALALRAGDIICCTLPSPPPLEALPEALPLDIVFEDEHLLVINKAAGMVVHPAPGHSSGTLVNALLAHCGPAAHQAGGPREPLLPPPPPFM
eukprot:jgi/Botrbrau1/3805/Bobra.0183s0037.1